MSTRILLVDDHRIVRDGLRHLLSSTPGLQVIGEASDGRTAVRMAAELAPDVVVMDIGLPDLNGIEATRQVLEQAPRVKVIALSMHSDVRFVSGMLRAGAAGYLLKDAAFEQLALAIETVIAGQTFLSPAIASTVIERFVRAPEPTAPSGAEALLTAREREVLQLLAEGRTTKEIALQLGVSIKTIETHRKQLMDKLGLRSIAELTKYAIREGLTSPQ